MTLAATDGGGAAAGTGSATPSSTAVAPESGEVAALQAAGSTPARNRFTRGLQTRLLGLLLLPLLLLALLSAWLDYRSADSAALRQDAQLLRMVPLMSDSVIVSGADGERPMVLLAPPVEEFLKDRAGFAAYSVSDPEGRVLHGESWLEGAVPETREPEFHSREHDGVLYRIVAQRVGTSAGDVVVQLADGSDPRQHWGRIVLLRVLLPNVVLLLVTAFAMNLAVRHALRPLIALKEAVERRSPRDLSPLDAAASPDEVRPLVQSLNRLFGLVNAQSESQRRFVADAAHQLRTPLAGLQAQVEAWAQAARLDLEENRASAQAGPAPAAIHLRAEDVLKLRDATRRTSQLAHQLLALSRADAHALHGQPPAPVDLKALCESMIEIHIGSAADKAIDLGLDAQPAQVVGHEWLLRELLGNLVDNAVKYTPRGGTVTLSCRTDGDGAVVEVEDDGPGIAPHERFRVLERFYRVRGTQGEGTGLGLAIADEIARLHGGRLQLSAGPGGRGLRVRVVLAAAPG
ncbi:sensor histidine kinase [uncultured Xylophilus sp.]|uniref:sensor histidine kinase n=1 Tax=uncultured Xylophilus sp. TaxID=296832 RepID=UPI0025EE0A21|nr:sensor histidine kinase [uncultured Xylophilus sp.]